MPGSTFSPLQVSVAREIIKQEEVAGVTTVDPIAASQPKAPLSLQDRAAILRIKGKLWTLLAEAYEKNFLNGMCVLFEDRFRFFSMRIIKKRCVRID